MADRPQPRFLDAGESALVVELGDAIDDAVNQAVVALDEACQAAAWPGVLETVPTYRSLLVLFDPLALARDELKRRILELHPAAPRSVSRRCWCLPVAYGGDHGMDLGFVAAAHGLSPEEVVAIHSAAEYRVYMIGFAPGFAYLGGLPERLHTGRRTDPRARIPGGSVSIGGIQAAVSPPFDLPSGWHVLGRTPARTCAPDRSGEPFLLAAGDRVRFRPIAASDFERLARSSPNGGAARCDLDA